RWQFWRGDRFYCRPYDLDLVRPDIAPEPIGYLCQGLKIINSCRSWVSCTKGAEQDYFTPDGRQSFLQEVRPSPDKGRNVNGQHDRGGAAGLGHIARPAHGHILAQTVHEPPSRPDIEPVHQIGCAIGGLIAAIGPPDGVAPLWMRLGKRRQHIALTRFAA